MHRLIEIATTEVGVQEIAGADHNERIIQYAHDIGHTWIDDDETPWCSVFMNWVAMKAGAERSGKANARSWLNVGLAVEHPEPGDVVVFWRGSRLSHQGHVGIFQGYSQDQSRVYVLGGNQGNQVSTTAYLVQQVLGFRRLRPVGEIALPEPSLKRGDRGPAVIELQDALKLAGYNPGTSDGIFGSRTEAALRELQATGDGLAISGVFDAETRVHLQDALKSR